MSMMYSKLYQAPGFKFGNNMRLAMLAAPPSSNEEEYFLLGSLFSLLMTDRLAEVL
jgi:hypothetical protein